MTRIVAQVRPVKTIHRRFHTPLMVLLTACVMWLVAPVNAWAVKCANGAFVKDAIYCPLIRFYRPKEQAQTDPRIADRFPQDYVGPVPIRSFALIVDVNDYANLPVPGDRELQASKDDLDDLIAFLTHQGFDEIIVLENKDAIKTNLSYFLDEYLDRQLKIYQKRARVLFAFSGHGAPGSTPQDAGSLVLYDADGSDSTGLYPLYILAPELRHLAVKAYQLVALLGSCYSGGIFTGSQANQNNNVFPGAPGAHAVTATKADDLAYAIGGERGTLFFHSLIAGVESGDGDRDYAGWIQLPDHTLKLEGNGIVRLGALTSYISHALDRKNPNTGKPFPQPLMGDLETGDGWGGAFFFLGPTKIDLKLSEKDKPLLSEDDKKDAKVTTLSVTRQSTGSAIVGRPDIIVFNPPDTYKISGVDLSHYNGRIDWPRLYSNGVDFAYMKATESTNDVDPTFVFNWENARRSKIARGAYHVFDFCKTADEQMAHISRTVPIDASALPLALDIEWKAGPLISREAACNNKDVAKAQIDRLLDLVRQRYGKAPVVHASAEGIQDLQTDRWEAAALWLQYYDKDRSRAGSGAVLSLPGSNPWTIWQVSGGGRLPGVSTKIDLDVFFGSKEDFSSFAHSGTNAAYVAAVLGSIKPAK